MKHSELITIITKQTGKEPTQQEIADILGLTRNAISSRAFRDKEYSYDEVKKISNHYGLNLFNDNLEEIKNSLLNKRMEYINSKDYMEVDYYPDVFGSCGNGTFVLSECKEPISIPKKCFTSFVNGKQYSVINAYGDSMMPYIHDKDKLIVEHWSGEQIKDNRVYVFRFGDNIFVKRLVQNINQIVVKSDNTVYDTMKIEAKDAGDLQIIGRIVGLMRDLD